MVRETSVRHLLKALSWNIIGFAIVVVTSLIFTGSIKIAGGIAVVDRILKVVVNYLHEKFWAKVKFGKEIEKYNGKVIWLTGLSGSGKTTIADALKAKLDKELIPSARIDGDIARRTFSKDLGFSKDDRDENNRRATHAAAWGSEDRVVICSLISPYRAQRDYARQLCSNFIEVYVKCSIKECERRDPKGLYRKVSEGKIKSFTGIHSDAPYEEPINPNIILDTEKMSVNECVQRLYEII